MSDGVRTDLFPISVRIVRSLVYGVAVSMFSTLGIRSLRVSYRLRGASFRVYSRRGVPPMSNRRWRRHYLMHYPSGIYPLPVEFWLTFPERGVLTCYEFGMLRYQCKSIGHALATCNSKIKAKVEKPKEKRAPTEPVKENGHGQNNSTVDRTTEGNVQGREETMTRATSTEDYSTPVAPKSFYRKEECFLR
ncbi:hypothetical protein Dimus_037033 [Dionaea muscipula]